MKIRLEYVWFDGYQPEPNLRSKVKIVEYESIKNSLALGVSKLPMWNFDGSSTKQAETGDSDRLLKPVRMYTSKVFPVELKTIYVLCEVLNPDGTPNKTNTRSKLNEEQEDLWLGFEQEYFIREEINGSILGHKRNILKGQGEYYCGVGHNVVGREFVEKHADMCLKYGIEITGTNAEVALGQWEYQVFSKGKLKGCDDLWMSRYFLYKISEEYGYHIDLHPKPIRHGEWNGSGLHTNFSTEVMREGDLNMTLWEREEYFKSIFSSFESRHYEHIKNYGSQNDLRLTGEYETQSIDKFSWGISDRGASIRVPKSTAEHWTGYLEDRRPGSNADPYKIVYQIMESIKNAVAIYKIKLKMNFDSDGSEHMDKFTGVISNDELLSEYRNDDDYEMGDVMEGSKSNIEPQQEIDLIQEYIDKKEGNFKSIPEALKHAMMNANEENM
jgi:glutamine synthetase